MKYSLRNKWYGLILGMIIPVLACEVMSQCVSS